MAVKHLCRILLFMVALTSGTSIASSLEIIQLRYRTADELVPLIKPHLPDTASISGANDRLVIRADAADIAMAQRLVNELDHEPRSVLVSVRQGSQASDNHADFNVSGDTHHGTRIRILRSDSAHSSQNRQQIRGLEGRPLQISTRTLLPMSNHIVWLGQHGAGSAKQTQLVELEGGLYAVPRLRDNQLEVDILIQDRSERDPLTSRQVVTTVSGQTGEWIAFASTGGADRDSSRGTIHRSRNASQKSETLWLRVDLLD